MPNATNAQFAGMNTEQLIQALSDNGYAADPGIPRAKLEEALGRLTQQRNRDSHSTSDKATKTFYDMYGALFKQTDGKRGCTKEQDPPVKIRFTHQDGDTELKFAYDGGYGFVKLDEKHVQKLPQWHLVSGQEYTIPWSVHEHLNSLMVQDSKPQQSADGFVRSQLYLRRRVISEPRLTREDVQKMAKRPPGRPRKEETDG